MGRPPLILLALVLALLAAATVVLAGAALSSDGDTMDRSLFLTGAFVTAGVGPVIALLLAVIGVAVAEILRLGTIAYYAVAGALIGLAASYAVDLSDALENTTDIAPVAFPLAVGAAAGLVGGIIYWAVVGKHRPQRAD